MQSNTHNRLAKTNVTTLTPITIISRNTQLKNTNESNIEKFNTTHYSERIG